MRAISFIRVFTIAAMMVSGLLELYAGGIFSFPLVQLSLGAAAGMAAAMTVKVLHII